MGRVRALTIGPPRANCAIVFGVALGILSAWPRTAPASPTGDVPRAAMEEFRGLCADLAEARERLAVGRLEEGAFADTLLAIFVRADSLAAWLSQGPRGNPSRITLQRATAYLIDSIRDNWVGVVLKNGMSFAEADIALKAAVAWRSNVAEAATSP